jgi:hypothetical protein
MTNASVLRFGEPRHFKFLRNRFVDLDKLIILLDDLIIALISGHFLDSFEPVLKGRHLLREEAMALMRRHLHGFELLPILVEGAVQWLTALGGIDLLLLHPYH